MYEKKKELTAGMDRIVVSAVWAAAPMEHALADRPFLSFRPQPTPGILAKNDQAMVLTRVVHFF